MSGYNGHDEMLRRERNWRARLAEAEAEIERLRAALAEIEQAANDGKAHGHIGYLARTAARGGDAA